MSSDLVDMGQGPEDVDAMFEEHIAAISRNYHIEPRLGAFSAVCPLCCGSLRCAALFGRLLLFRGR